MKAACFSFLLILGALFVGGVDGARSQDKTITKVVKLLQKMLDKSKQDAEDDKNLYAKYKCYVDTTKAEKEQSIKDLTEQISLLESKIAELQARNGELSLQSAQLQRDMDANKAAQKSATTIREDSEKNFKTMEEELGKGIGQMTEAIDVLNAISLQQQHASGHKKTAALLNLGTQVRESLTAASALLPTEQKHILESFLEAPLSAAHVAQGDAIVGVLKNLKDTFKKNLENARDSEKAEKKAFDDSIDTLDKSWKKMDGSLKEKEQELGENDDELSSKKTALEKAIQQKADDEEFLGKLIDVAEKKAKNYEERKMLRANEDAAIAEAISILNSDEAFATFGTTDATSTGGTGAAASFLQLRQLRGGAALQQAESMLEHAAVRSHSMRLARIATSLRSGHVFTAVMDEIEKMKKTISEEGVADKENLDWCNKERDNSNTDLDAKKSQIKSLKEAIDKLVETIDDPKTGLKVKISDTEDSLVENQKTQKEETDQRNKENVAYQKDVANLSDAEDILAKAIKVLKKYYDGLDKHMKENTDSTNLLQEEPKSDVGYGDFSGQSESGGKAIDMLVFIEGETKKEHKKADDDEASSLKDYKDSREQLLKDEADMQQSLIDLREKLTAAEKELQEKRSDHKDTVAAKEAIEKYLEKIKPGCDFITENFDVREENRATETEALNKAKGLIEATPAYKTAVAKQEDKCKADCKLDTTSLGCKVCMSGSSKDDYCKGHPGTPGCK